MIGIVTALEKEYAAMKTMLDRTEERTVPGEGAGRRYLLGQIPARGGGHHTVTLALADMGNNAAAIRATQMLNHFPQLKHIVMVGIAGGIPNPAKPDEHVRLGDVVVSGQDGVIQYDFDKETYDFRRDKPIITPRSRPRPPSSFLVEAVRLMQADDQLGQRPWLAFIERTAWSLGAARPAEEMDYLYDSNVPDKQIQHPYDPNRSPDQPRVFLGTIASANKLLKNPKLRDLLRDKYSVKAVEMEASGIADATWNRETGYLVVRGICDYCDSHKNDTWQSHAAIVAAAYMRGLLVSTPAIGADAVDITQVQVIIERKSTTFDADAQQDWIGILATILHIDADHIRVLNVAPGSVVITLDMPTEAAYRLRSLFRQRDYRLLRLKMVSIQLEGDEAERWGQGKHRGIEVPSTARSGGAFLEDNAAIEQGIRIVNADGISTADESNDDVTARFLKALDQMSKSKEPLELPEPTQLVWPPDPNLKLSFSMLKSIPILTYDDVQYRIEPVEPAGNPIALTERHNQNNYFVLPVPNDRMGKQLLIRRQHRPDRADQIVVARNVAAHAPGVDEAGSEADVIHLLGEDRTWTIHDSSETNPYAKDELILVGVVEAILIPIFADNDSDE